MKIRNKSIDTADITTYRRHLANAQLSLFFSNPVGDYCFHFQQRDGCPMIDAAWV